MCPLLDGKQATIWLSALALLAALATGCNSSASNEKSSAELSSDSLASDGPPLRVAVIDVNEVARQIGAMEKMEQSLAKFESELNQTLIEFQKQLDEEYNAQRDKFGADLNRQQQSELDALLDRHQVNLVDQASLAQTRLQAHREQLRLKLLNEVRPIAYEVAARRGMSLVLTTAQVYAAPPGADITGEVIDRIRQLNATEGDASTETAAPQHTARLPDGGEFKPY